MSANDHFQKITFWGFVAIMAALFLMGFAGKLRAAEVPVLRVVCEDGTCTGRIRVSAAAEKSLFCWGKIRDATNQHPDLLDVYTGYLVDKKERFFNEHFLSGRTKEGRTLNVRDIDAIEILSGGRVLCEAVVSRF